MSIRLASAKLRCWSMVCRKAWRRWLAHEDIAAAAADSFTDLCGG